MKYRINKYVLPHEYRVNCTQVNPRTMFETRPNEPDNPFRTMGFVVDKISEDSFYENLLLGLPKALERSPYVANLQLRRAPGLRPPDIRHWEQTNGANLPDGLRAFYNSTNGFLYTYEFSYPDEQGPVRTGKIEVNPLNELVRIYGYETKSAASIERNGDKRKLNLSKESKVFELSTVDDNAKVALVYAHHYEPPTIWLYTNKNMTFHYITHDFAVYLRMCLAHLGAPCWQYVASKEGLPEWAREIFTLLAPGVLEEERNLVEMPAFDVETNRIDPAIFLNSSPSSTTLFHTLQQSKSKEKKIRTVAKKISNSRVNKNVK
ncbi:unnamed protein product [Phyllotreta striolata]|uniref:Tubulin polyglutamylase complex subunit 2 n=1 Tax=Phyllotreta striolata TaxID=444603 RepID=A0A9N9TX09_PHYSR|nr:unnamed protein product [Phyllotreta striolata]